MPPAGRRARRGALTKRVRYTKITEVPLGTLSWAEIPPEARKRLAKRFLAWALPVYERVITQQPIKLTEKVTVRDHAGAVVEKASYTKTTEYTPDVTLARVWALDLARLSIGEVAPSIAVAVGAPAPPGTKGEAWMPPLVLPAVQVPREPTAEELAEQEAERSKRPGATALNEELTKMTDELFAAAAKKLRKR